MGILNFLKRLIIDDEEEYVEGDAIHVHDLPNWVEKRSERIINTYKLEEETHHYVNLLKDKRLILEGKLAQWEKELMPQEKEEANQIFSTGEKVMEKLVFPKTNLDNVLPQHQQLVSVLDQTLKTVEGIDHQLKGSWVNELIDLKKYVDEFNGKISQVGFGKIETLREKVIIIGEHSEHLRNLRKELGQKKDKLERIEAKKREKQAELRPLEENAHYPAFKMIKEERAGLLAELEGCDDIHQKFEIKERIDLLEKAVGNKDFILRVDEALYRVEHYIGQGRVWRKQIDELEEEIVSRKAQRDHEIEMFVNLVKVSLGEDVEVRV